MVNSKYNLMVIIGIKPGLENLKVSLILYLFSVKLTPGRIMFDLELHHGVQYEDDFVSTGIYI